MSSKVFPGKLFPAKQHKRNISQNTTLLCLTKICSLHHYCSWIYSWESLKSELWTSDRVLNQFVSVLMNCSWIVRRGKRAVGCYSDLNISSWVPDRSSPSSHQKMSSYDQKKGRNKTDSYISYFELSSCCNCDDAVHCSFGVSRKSVKYPSLFEQGSFLSNC